MARVRPALRWAQVVGWAARWAGSRGPRSAYT